MGVEDEFDVEIDDDDLVLENFETTGRIASYIKGLLPA
jgi:acyl carrier protein